MINGMGPRNQHRGQAPVLEQVNPSAQQPGMNMNNLAAFAAMNGGMEMDKMGPMMFAMNGMNQQNGQNSQNPNMANLAALAMMNGGEMKMDKAGLGYLAMNGMNQQNGQ